MKLCPALPPLLICLAACSSEPAGRSPDPASANDGVPASAAPATPTAPPPPSAPAPPAADVLTLEGLGPLRIGRAVPSGSGWAERGAQISEDCRTVSSPDFPGTYAIVEDGKVARITVGRGSGVKLVEGLGVGSPEAEVRAAFAGFRSEPHKYSESPAKYLTAPNADSGDPALRFEIGADGKVALIHIGVKPVLFYVEGCA